MLGKTFEIPTPVLPPGLRAPAYGGVQIAFATAYF